MILYSPRFASTQDWEDNDTRHGLHDWLNLQMNGVDVLFVKKERAEAWVEQALIEALEQDQGDDLEAAKRLRQTYKTKLAFHGPDAWKEHYDEFDGDNPLYYSNIVEIHVAAE